MGVHLSEANRQHAVGAGGFAHGYLALSERVDFLYKCTDYYAPQQERAIRWDDARIGIHWPLPAGRGTAPVRARCQSAAIPAGGVFSMKVLITGARGQLGRALLSSRPPQAEIRAYAREELDICDKAAVAKAVAEFAPAVLINAAAYTAVDWAETDPLGAMAANSMGPDLLAEAVRGIPGARLIHISTDYVFDGSGKAPHRPDDPTGPLSVYGRTKLAGEQNVLSRLGERAVVLRTAWVYAPQGRNFLLTMLRLMKERGSVNVVADQRGSPTTAASVASAVWRIAERPQVHGVLHWTDAGAASWYDFALAIAEEGQEFGLLQKGVVVKPIGTLDYPTAAQRPANSVLDVTKSVQQLGLEPTPWRQNLRSTLLRMASH